MDNSKKNVHSSGPLGMLVKTGQIKKFDSNDEPEDGGLKHVGLDRLKTTTSSYFRTQSGVEFKENELVFVDSKECEPWEYANRSEDEMGDMTELMTSIRENTQLQPALVRTHPNPHDGIKYQIIFGRRRHAACLSLDVPFLVIKKDTLSKQEAIACQDAENKFRKNVSNFSNAKLYKKLLDDRTFKMEKDLAVRLGMSSSSLNDLMSFTKIPMDLVNVIPNIHTLSVSMSLKIVQLISQDKDALATIKEIASGIGSIITSPTQLERIVKAAVKGEVRNIQSVKTPAMVIKSDFGKKLFTLKYNKDLPCIVFNKDFSQAIDFPSLCEHLKNYLENVTESTISQSGAPDSLAG